MAARTFPSASGLPASPTQLVSIRRSARNVMGTKLVAQLGLDGPGLFGEHCAATSTSTAGLSRGRPHAAARRRASRPIARTRRSRRCSPPTQIAATPCRPAHPTTGRLLQRARASYYPGRSGDFVVVLKKDVTPIADTTPLRRHPRQPVGLRPPRADPVLAAGRAGTTVEQPGRDHRHHADAGGDDRPCRSPPGSIDGHCLDGVAGCAFAPR